MTDAFIEMFSEKMILLDYEAKNREDLLTKLSRYLYDSGYVAETFANAILEREKEYPTGLPTEGVKVALPHTYPVHTKRPCILVVNLRNPIAFKEMGNGVNDILAELVFAIVVTEPKSQIMSLQKLMGIFTKKELLLELKNAVTVRDTYAILKREFS